MAEERLYVKDNERLDHVTIGVGKWRNFSGVKTETNRFGTRKFNIFLPRGLATELLEIGWYVKEHAPYREDDDPFYTLEIEASYDTHEGKFPIPLVKMVSYDGVEVLLNEETIGQLDKADISEATVEIRPNNWRNANGKSGCKAYLQELIVYLKKPRMARDATLRREEEDY